MIHGQEADLFVLMTAKEELTTRDGKPYFKVGFRDAPRGGVSDLARFALGRRLPQEWPPGDVLQAAGRVSRDELRPAARNPQDSRSLPTPTRPTASIPGCSCRTVALRPHGDVRRACDDRARADRRPGSLRRWCLRSWKPIATALLTLPAATHNHHALSAASWSTC